MKRESARRADVVMMPRRRQQQRELSRWSASALAETRYLRENERASPQQEPQERDVGKLRERDVPATRSVCLSVSQGKQLARGECWLVKSRMGCSTLLLFWKSHGWLEWFLGV